MRYKRGHWVQQPIQIKWHNDECAMQSCTVRWICYEVVIEAVLPAEAISQPRLFTLKRRSSLPHRTLYKKVHCCCYSKVLYLRFLRVKACHTLKQQIRCVSCTKTFYDCLQRISHLRCSNALSLTFLIIYCVMKMATRVRH